MSFQHQKLARNIDSMECRTIISKLVEKRASQLLFQWKPSSKLHAHIFLYQLRVYMLCFGFQNEKSSGLDVETETNHVENHNLHETSFMLPQKTP